MTEIIIYIKKAFDGLKKYLDKRIPKEYPNKKWAVPVAVTPGRPHSYYDRMDYEAIKDALIFNVSGKGRVTKIENMPNTLNGFVGSGNLNGGISKIVIDDSTTIIGGNNFPLNFVHSLSFERNIKVYVDVSPSRIDGSEITEGRVKLYIEYELEE